MADIGKIEYRVRPVTRYVVTRYFESESRTTGGSEPKGEYDNGEIAYQVAYALAKEEHERLGLPPGDERIVYPESVLSGVMSGGLGNYSAVAAATAGYAGAINGEAQRLTPKRGAR